MNRRRPFGIQPNITGGRALYVPRNGPAYEAGADVVAAPDAPQQVQSPFAGGQAIGTAIPAPLSPDVPLPGGMHSPNFLNSVARNNADAKASAGTFAAAKTAGLSDADSRRQAYIATHSPDANQPPPPPTILMGGRSGATVLPPGVASPAYIAGGHIPTPGAPTGTGFSKDQLTQQEKLYSDAAKQKRTVYEAAVKGMEPDEKVQQAHDDYLAASDELSNFHRRAGGLDPQTPGPTTQPAGVPAPGLRPPADWENRGEGNALRGKDQIKVTPEIAQSMYQVQHDQLRPGETDDKAQSRLNTKLQGDYGITPSRAGEIQQGLQPPTNPAIPAAPTEVLLHRQPVDSPIWQPFVKTPSGTGVHIGAGLYQFPDGRVVPTDQAGKTLGPAMQGARPPNLGFRYQLPTPSTIAAGSQPPQEAVEAAAGRAGIVPPPVASGFESEYGPSSVPPPSMSPLAQASPAAVPPPNVSPQSPTPPPSVRGGSMGFPPTSVPPRPPAQAAQRTPSPAVQPAVAARAPATQPAPQAAAAPAQAAQAQAPPTDADIQFTAQKYGMTPDQVRAKLGL